MSGISAHTVDVEVETEAEGKAAYIIIGMGDIAVRESRDRVVSALRNSGFYVPARILVNLAPAELKKEGATFDVAIAVGILASSGALRRTDLEGVTFHGELSLNGAIKPVKGMVAHAIEALQRGAEEIIVPRENLSEAALISGIAARGVASIAELVAYLEGELLLPDSAPLPDNRAKRRMSLGEVRGQRAAKRALTIAAAGGHNLLMVGPPGCGKSMLAERFPCLLPDLSRVEMLDAVKIHSVAGLSVERLLQGERPFRSPHHLISEAGLLGGSSVPRPGEVSLAHHGVLFLDELPEFRRGALEGLRQPLEAGRLLVSRAKGSFEFPAAFQLLAAMNSCPCGRLGVKGASCICTRAAVYAYLKKISLPILDRIDLHVDVDAVSPDELQQPAEKGAESDASLRDTVVDARERALDRAHTLNARLQPKQVESFIKPSAEAVDLLRRTLEIRPMSARGYFRVLKVARTIADLERHDRVERSDISEALGYRSLERIEEYCRGGRGRVVA